MLCIVVIRTYLISLSLFFKKLMCSLFGILVRFVCMCVCGSCVHRCAFQIRFGLGTPRLGTPDLGFQFCSIIIVQAFIVPVEPLFVRATLSVPLIAHPLQLAFQTILHRLQIVNSQNPHVFPVFFIRTTIQK